MSMPHSDIFPKWILRAIIRPGYALRMHTFSAEPMSDGWTFRQFAGKFSVMWLKKGINRDNKVRDVLISTNSILVARESRFALRHDPGSDTYTLQVTAGSLELFILRRDHCLKVRSSIRGDCWTTRGS